tara:strand:- start:75 stop:572 length:498 start_codon:yes stop_codon:yes gene_type:complete
VLVKFKVKKKGSKLKKLTEGVLKLNGESVSVGHFQRSGKHYSGFTYPQLMAIQHFGLGGQIPRQLILLLWFYNRRLQDQQFDDAMMVWGKSRYSETSTKNLLDSFGKILAKKEKDLFGQVTTFTPATKSTKRVGVSGPTAPLIDTGMLRDMIRYTTSKSKVLKKV